MGMVNGSCGEVKCGFWQTGSRPGKPRRACRRFRCYRRGTLGLDSPPELPRQQRATIRDGGVNVNACLQRVDLFDFLDHFVEGGQRDYLNCVEGCDL